MVEQGLAANRTLQELYLLGNNIGDVGGSALAQALRENVHVEWLYLKDNEITSVGGMAFVDAYKSNPQLITVVDLDDNKCACLNHVCG